MAMRGRRRKSSLPSRLQQLQLQAEKRDQERCSCDALHTDTALGTSFACIPELSGVVQEEPAAPKRETYEVTTEVKAGTSRQRGSRADALLTASKEAFPDGNVSVKPVSQV